MSSKAVDSQISERHGFAVLANCRGEQFGVGIEGRSALVEAYYMSQSVARAFQASCLRIQASHWTFEMLRVLENPLPQHAIVMKRMPRIS